MTNAAIAVTFLGTGNPFGLPAPGCRCETCQQAEERGIRRTRSGIHVRNEETGQALLIDVSPDWWYQHVINPVSLADEVVITHIHYDHVYGLPSTIPFYSSLPVHVAESSDMDPNDSIAGQLRSQFEWMGSFDVNAHPPREVFTSCGFEVRLLPVRHDDTPTFGVSITEPTTETTVAITSDTCFRIPDASRDAMRGADLLVTEAFCPVASLDADMSDRNTPYAMPSGRDRNDGGVPLSVGAKHLTHEGALQLSDELAADQTKIVHTSHFYPPAQAFDAPIANDGDRILL